MYVVKAEYNILFNGNKSKLLCFNGGFCKPLKVGIEVSAQFINISKSDVHLGQTIRKYHYQSVKSSINKDVNLVMSNFSSLGPTI